MNNISTIIIAIVCFGAALYFLFGVCFPRFRGFWGRTPVPCGWVSFAGIALFLGGAGLALVTPYGRVFIVAGFAGGVITTLGAVLDKRAYVHGAAARKPPSSERQTGSLKDFSPMSIFVLSIVLFTLFLWLVLFHTH